MRVCNSCLALKKCSLHATNGKFYCDECHDRMDVGFKPDDKFYRKKAHVSTSCRYSSKFTFFICIKGIIKRFSFSRLKTAVRARKYFIESLSVSGYLITS